MTIGELEALLDMPRASIRFYEQEGFIHPKREANNYRDYSEEDADTLRKVKLLRQLGPVPGGHPAGPAGGSAPWRPCWRSRRPPWPVRGADLDWAGQICHAMREDGWTSPPWTPPGT